MGNYKQSITLCQRARDLLSLWGVTGGTMDHAIMISQAAVHGSKSEFVEAQAIQNQILQETSFDPRHHALALINVAAIDILMDTPKENVQRNIDAVKSIFTTIGQQRMIWACDSLQADLNLREGAMLGAKALFCKCLKASWGQDSEAVMYCLERLGDVNWWNFPHCELSWTTMFLAQCIRSKAKLGVHKALQFLGDIFLLQDADTAISLFTVSLNGFTQMDVHCSRAECMLSLGNMFQGHGAL
jgi:hypothetical protein